MLLYISRATPGPCYCPSRDRSHEDDYPMTRSSGPLSPPPPTPASLEGRGTSPHHFIEVMGSGPSGTTHPRKADEVHPPCKGAGRSSRMVWASLLAPSGLRSPDRHGPIPPSVRPEMQRICASRALCVFCAGAGAFAHAHLRLRKNHA